MAPPDNRVRARYPRLMEVDDPPRIVGHRCRQCDRVAFPPDPYGCERCGAGPEELSRQPLVARGTVQALATVHRHHRPTPETPFTVATVVLEEGVVLKAVLDDRVLDDRGGSARVGSRVLGVTVPWETEEDGTEVVDLRFRVADPVDRSDEVGG